MVDESKPDCPSCAGGDLEFTVFEDPEGGDGCSWVCSNCGGWFWPHPSEKDPAKWGSENG